MNVNWLGSNELNWLSLEADGFICLLMNKVQFSGLNSPSPFRSVSTSSLDYYGVDWECFHEYKICLGACSLECSIFLPDSNDEVKECRLGCLKLMKENHPLAKDAGANVQEFCSCFNNFKRK